MTASGGECKVRQRNRVWHSGNERKWAVTITLEMPIISLCYHKTGVQSIKIINLSDKTK